MADRICQLLEKEWDVTCVGGSFMQVVMGLSGGLDSTHILLGVLLNEGKMVHCCIFDHGSTQGKYEIEAANKVVEYYQEE